MSTEINLKEIEQKTYHLVRQDGVDRIAAGIFLALAAIFFIDIRFAGVLGLGSVIYTVLPDAFRKKLTYPRIGYAKFLPASRTLWHHLLRIIMAIICLTLFYLLGKIARFSWLMPLYLGIIFSAVALIGVRKSGTAIDYILAVLFLSSGIAGLAFTISRHDPGWVTAYQLWGLAGILIPLGMIQLIHFLGKYPEPKEEVSHVK